jgi:hypothetical protein
MDDRSCALLNLSSVKKQKVCAKFSTLEALRVAIADGSIHKLDRGWGTEFVREVENALAAYDKDHPLSCDVATEKDKDRTHLSTENEKTRAHATAENERNRKTDWRKALLAAAVAIVVGILGLKWYSRAPEEKPDRSKLPETTLHKHAEAGEVRKSRDALTEPVLHKQADSQPEPDTLNQEQFLPKWKKAREDGTTALAEFAKANQRGRVKEWKCTFMNVMTTSANAKFQGIEVAFDDDETLIGTCFLPEGDKSSRFSGVDHGTPLILVAGNRQMITHDAAQFSDCQFRR